METKVLINNKNILQYYSSSDNKNIIYDSVCDIFRKKSNFNIERIIGRKQAYAYIHLQMKDIYNMFISNLLNSKKDLVECITLLNKYTIQNVVIVISKSTEYKNFINSIKKPLFDTSVVIPKPRSTANNPPVVTKNYKPAHTIEQKMNHIKESRQQNNKINSIDFKIDTEEHKLDTKDMEDILSKYNEARLETKDVKPDTDEEISLDFITNTLFGDSTHEEHEAHAHDEHDEHEAHAHEEHEEHEEHAHEAHETAKIIDTIDATMYNLNLIKEYFIYMSNFKR